MTEAQKMPPDIVRVWFLREGGARVVIEKAGSTVLVTTFLTLPPFRVF
jgi:hypothetical protein